MPGAIFITRAVSLKRESEAVVGQAKRRATEMRPKAVRGSIFRLSSKCRPEVADAVIFGVAGGLFEFWPAGPVLCTVFAVFNCILQL